MISSNLTAQTEGVKFFRSLDHQKLSIESIQLMTDRNLYCVGEKIFYSARYVTVEAINRFEWSKEH